MGDVTAVDARILARCVGPVLDAGCGPARHVEALAGRGVPALGVDISGHLLELARAKDVVVLERSIFDRLPATGRWATVLLLDGNLGIGGDPVALLERVGELLRPDGRVLVEFDAPGNGLVRSEARVELDGRPGPWFRWAQVGACQAELIACACQELELVDLWHDEGRWFGAFRRRAG
jgi:SAM-dependent methyltransferase